MSAAIDILMALPPDAIFGLAILIVAGASALCGRGIFGSMK